MARPLSRLPSLTNWRAAAARLGLRRQGRELIGPCPACGGEDRFRITLRGGFFCRQCCPDRNAGGDAMRRIIEAAGLADERKEANGRAVGAPGSIADASLRHRSNDAGPPARPSDSMERSRAEAAPVRQQRDEEDEADARDRQTPAHPPNGAPGRFTGDEIRRSGPDSPSSEAAGRKTARGARDESEAEDASIRCANRIWGAATQDPAPVRTYLASRGAWPPADAWPAFPGLPPAVRWLSRAAAERLNPDLPERLRIRLPGGADGCAVYAYGPPGAGWLQAVQIEPLTADGRRAPWPARKPGGKPMARQSRGPMRGTALPVKPHDADPVGPLHIAEGPVDALAIACWRGVGAWSAGGTSGLAALAPALAATGRAVVIEADGDDRGKGLIAATTLKTALRAVDAEARLTTWPGCDPAEGLAADWQECAARLEAGGMDRAKAEAQAWNAMRRPAADEPGERGDNRQPDPQR